MSRGVWVGILVTISLFGLGLWLSQIQPDLTPPPCRPNIAAFGQMRYAARVAREQGREDIATAYDHLAAEHICYGQSSGVYNEFMR